MIIEGKTLMQPRNLFIQFKSLAALTAAILVGMLGFGDLAHVVVPFLHPKSSESQRTLTTSAVFLRQIDTELRDHFA